MIENEWNFDNEVFQMHVRDFFMGLYKMDYLISGSLASNHSFPTLNGSDMNSMLTIASDEEIRRAIFSMAL